MKRAEAGVQRRTANRRVVRVWAAPPNRLPLAMTRADKSRGSPRLTGYSTGRLRTRKRLEIGAGIDHLRRSRRLRQRTTPAEKCEREADKQDEAHASIGDKKNRSRARAKRHDPQLL